MPVGLKVRICESGYPQHPSGKSSRPVGWDRRPVAAAACAHCAPSTIAYEPAGHALLPMTPHTKMPAHARPARVAATKKQTHTPRTSPRTHKRAHTNKTANKRTRRHARSIGARSRPHACMRKVCAHRDAHAPPHEYACNTARTPPFPWATVCVCTCVFGYASACLRAFVCVRVPLGIL